MEGSYLSQADGSVWVAKRLFSLHRQVREARAWFNEPSQLPHGAARSPRPGLPRVVRHQGTLGYLVPRELRSLDIPSPTVPAVPATAWASAWATLKQLAHLNDDLRSDAGRAPAAQLYAQDTTAPATAANPVLSAGS
jgi:hypothetical protein